MVCLFLFSPVLFNRRVLSRPPCWRLAAAGPLGCALLHSVALKFYSDHLSSWLVHTYPEARLSSIVSGLYFAAGFTPAFTYLAIWLIGTGSLVCVHVLLDGSGPCVRILELTGLAFYSQVPYLVALVIGSLVFELSPGEPTGAGSSPGEIVAALQQSLDGSLAYQLVRHFGYAFRAWLVLLFVLAYRASAGPGRVVMPALVGLFLAVLFVVEPWTLK